MERKALEAPVFFSSASRVKIPYVGDDTRYIKPKPIAVNLLINPLERHQRFVGNFALKQVCQFLDFGFDVVKERCAYALPYDEQEILKTYDCSDIIPYSPRSAASGGRFNTRGFRQKVPSHIKKFVSPNAARMRIKPKTVTERCGSVQPDVIDKSYESRTGEPFTLLSKAGTPRPSSLYPPSDNMQQPKRKSVTAAAEWDECIIDRLSKDTARWIVLENVEPGLQKERLDGFLRNKFGAKVSNTNLIREEGKESNIELIEKEKAEKLKKKREQRKLAQKIERIQQVQDDPVLSQTFAQYYKLPRYLKQKKRLDPPQTNQVNQSAQTLKVKRLEPLPPPKMEDFFNPAAGSYVYKTDNAFEQQLYTNQAKPVHQHDGDRTRIIMNDLSEYQCSLQHLYPPQPQQWSKGIARKDEVTVKSARCAKGMQRWKELPNPADFASELGLNMPKYEFEREETMKLTKSTLMLENAPLISIIEEWRSKWKLAGRWQEVTLADVLLDMGSLHAHVRLGAVAACAMAALHKLPVEEVTVLAVLPKIDASVLSNQKEVGHLFKDLLEKVRERLDDNHHRVQMAAAICLYTLSECTDGVIEILHKNLEHGIPADRMACAQCLALRGSADATVVHLLIKMLLETDQQQQATALLVHLSQYTRLVHSLLAEQLNSCSWKDKVIACNVLSELSGSINRDLVHKLSNLMWEDWSSEVRNAASRVLGKTGHGRDIHYELREKLIRGNERVCVDVLKKIAHLRIMTASLLPEFLNCFSAEYVSVRLEAVQAAEKLKIKENRIVKELLRLIQYDHSWKVKAHAIKAIGEIGVSSNKLQEALIWAVRFENEPGIRMEACVALRKVVVDAEDVMQVLQDRVLVEPDPYVKQEVKKTLDTFGMSGPEDNMEMIRQVKSEVRKLSKKSVVAAKVLLYERELDKFERKAQYIGEMEDDLETVVGSEGDDVDLEITRALRRSKSGGETGHRSRSTLRTPSEGVTPIIRITPGSPLPDKSQIEIRVTPTAIAEERNLAPSPDVTNRSLSPDQRQT